MDAPEVDWDSIAVPRARQRSPRHVRLVDDAAMAPLALAERNPEANRGLAVAKVSQVWRIALPAPQKRYRDQHVLAAARMRDGKANKYRLRQVELHISQINNALSDMRRAGKLLHNGTTVAKFSKRGKLIVDGLLRGRRRALSYSAAVAIAYSDLDRRNDVARSYKISPKTVSRLRCVVAHASWLSDSAFLDGCAASFAQNGLSIFVASLSCDATKEKLLVPMHSGLVLSTWRSSWNVLVSSQRFAWSFKRSADNNAENKWFQIEFMRANTPIISDNAECIYDGLYGVLAQQPWRRAEEAGFHNADLRIALWDLDGRLANGRMVSVRRSSLLPGTMVDLRHCGNHAANLVEACVAPSVSVTVLGVLYTSAIFFRMGGNFLRLIHATFHTVRKNMLLGLRNPVDFAPPPPGPAIAKLAAEGIRDNAIHNYKSFSGTTAVDEAWPSDDGNQSSSNKSAHKSRPRHQAYISAWDRFVSFWGYNFWRDGKTRPSRRRHA